MLTHKLVALQMGLVSRALSESCELSVMSRFLPLLFIYLSSPSSVLLPILCLIFEGS